MVFFSSIALEHNPCKWRFLLLWVAFFFFPPMGSFYVDYKVHSFWSHMATHKSRSVHIRSGNDVQESPITDPSALRLLFPEPLLGAGVVCKEKWGQRRPVCDG